MIESQKHALVWKESAASARLPSAVGHRRNKLDSRWVREVTFSQMAPGTRALGGVSIGHVRRNRPAG